MKRRNFIDVFISHRRTTRCWRPSFLFTEKGKNPPSISNDDNEWTDVLQRLDEALLYPVSSRIYVDGMARAVTGEEIVIIKRNEKMFWTRSMAQEDVEATLLQAMRRE